MSKAREEAGSGEESHEKQSEAFLGTPGGQGALASAHSSIS